MCCVLVIMGIILLGILKEFLSPDNQNRFGESRSVITTERPKLSKDKQKKDVKAVPTLKAAQNPFQSWLNRFQQLKGKVLLTEAERKERERILSDSKMLGWIEGQLSDPQKVPELAARLSLIDFLEDAITWKENPIRFDAINSIERLIRSDTIDHASKTDKVTLVGDKIELFAILYQELPDKAEALLSQAKNTPLEDILNYAKTRLSLTKKLLEDAR